MIFVRVEEELEASGEAGSAEQERGAEESMEGYRDVWEGWITGDYRSRSPAGVAGLMLRVVMPLFTAA